MPEAQVTCTLCGDTGWTPAATATPPRMVRCDCRLAQQVRALVSAAGLPSRYVRCGFEDFLLYENERLVRAVEASRRFAAAYPAVARGLCFIGPPGIGKTHLAAAILQDVIPRTRAVAKFYDTRDLLRQIRETYTPGAAASEMSIIREVIAADLVVLDDLGSEKPSEWVSETMTLLVNGRYNAQRTTIVTTNYEDLPDDEVDGLRARVGGRLHSRLHEMCEFVEFSGGDYRLLPPNGDGADLSALWKLARARGRGGLPRRTMGPARAQLPLTPGLMRLGARSASRAWECRWPGGKFGRS